MLRQSGREAVVNSQLEEPMSERLTLPVLPLREIVLFPCVSTPIGTGHPQAVLREVKDLPPRRPDDPACVGLHREARERAAELGQKSGLPEEVVRQVLEGVSDPGRLADLVAGYLEIDPAERQALLET